MDAVVRHLRERSDVDQSQLAIGGVSRGGILSIAYAGMRPNTFRGAINFNGGWLGRGCPNHEIVNPSLFERGAAAGISTLWLHGSHDQYYRIGHCRGNYKRFLLAGGQGQFIAAAAGHALMFKPALWKNHLDLYMDGLAAAELLDQ
ncbi:MULTISPECIES: prolyl oligopeptidase family serine peptidase [Rhizobium]|uniref:prolyl oligopeptidase family serine peptidase n=1 Tax=Rhizobium TaxID=379 RepID=UPI001FDEA4FC|nr:MULTISPECIES: prolyl oligopeptidase family serine peptidase [Rhizobium]